jgi:putative ABC transport system permease protein
VLTVVRLRDEIVGDRADALALLLLATVAVVAVICGNLAQLLLARASHRASEFATRKALGAGTWPLLRFALSESLVLAALGGAAGVGVAYWLLPVLLSLAPQGIPRLAGASIDARILIVTVAATLVTGVLFGLAPALRLSRVPPSQVMRTGATDSQPGRARTQSLLITLQVTVAVTLFVLASVVVDRLMTLLPSSPGFATDSRAAFLWTIDERRLAAAGERRRRLIDWRASVEALPEVHGVAVASAIPFGDDEPRRVGIRSPNDLVPITDATPRAAMRAVSSNYFTLMNMPLWRGRYFDAADRTDATRVAIVNRTLAMRLDPGSDVVGRRIRIGNTDAALDYEIVGIAPDTRWWGMTIEPLDEVYVPLAQDRSSFGYLVVHSSLSAAALTDVLRREFFAAFPGASLPADRRAVLLQEMVNASIAGPRFSAAVIGSFSTVTLLLAAMGTFGLVASTLAARRRELGIRTALGARPSNLLHLTLWPVLSLTLAGIIAGLAIGAGVTRVAQRQLYVEGSTHPSLLGAAAVVMLVASGLAAYFPATRAIRMDPSSVLRDQ